MSFLERAKQAAEQARHVASEAAEQAKAVTIEASERTQATLRDPATKERARSHLHRARRGFATALERIDPAILADVIMKATLLQEKANAALRSKGSPYRISEIAIGASIPPSIQFSIGRLDDPADDPALMPPTPPEPSLEAGNTVTALDGTDLDDKDLEELDP
jgi:hypothetical protein